MSFMKRISVDASLGALVLVLGELFIASFFGRKELVGAWELGQALLYMAPLGWLAALPMAAAGALLLEGTKRSRSVVSNDTPLLDSLMREGTRPPALPAKPSGTHPPRDLLRRPGRERRFRLLVALSAGLFGGLVAFGVSTGRHFASLPLRTSFCALLALTGFTLAYLLAPPLGRLLRARPRATALLALATALLLELANLFILPRLYPAFHTALLALTMALAPVVAQGIHALPIPKLLASWRLGGSLLLPCIAVIAAAPFFAKRLSYKDNLRLVYLERAPLLRQGIELGAKLSPPPPLDPTLEEESQATSTRALDWQGRDIVLISVDALRADHVGAYGYARTTTPHLDALAAEGALFERAYAPTPHTSYSIASLMTGKPMRPLVLQGLGEDSDTFAKLLRAYGYRTAAFYPPAVFFIDGDKLAGFRDSALDFEYRKIEFADAPERLEQVEAYLSRRKPDRRLFLWVHLFEPHEPYVAHPEHPFGERDIDRYDSEIKAADRGIGDIVHAVRKRRPEAVVIVTADHGEEFGDHGGRFHGTSVYEEQVRVPLVVSAPGSIEPRRISLPVQTIDILPTVLSALDIPRPARVRGRDLGRLLRDGKDESFGEGLAVAETEDQTMLAEGSFRLVCQRRIGACALYDLTSDPGQKRDVSSSEGPRFEAMKERLRKLAASHGRYERAGLRSEGKVLPEALRRGLAGDGDAALEIASLLDDAEVLFRRKAAEVLFSLRRNEVAPQLRLALARDEDEEVRRWAALASTRLGEVAPLALELLHDADPMWSRFAALALADAGDARGGEILASWAGEPPDDFVLAREIVEALARIREKRAVPALLLSLDDIRLRPHSARALGEIGDISARKALSERLAHERYEPSRIALAEALVALSAKDELAGPLLRFLGTPDPLPGGLGLALRAGVLEEVGGARKGEGTSLDVTVPRGGNGKGLRVLVRGKSQSDEPATVRVGTALLTLPPSPDPVEVHAPLVEPPPKRAPLRLAFEASPNALVDAIAVVPLTDEIPPPSPEPWEGQAGDDQDEPD